MNDPAILVALVGLLGSVLAWMMGRLDRRIDRLDRRLDGVDISVVRFSKALLLEVVSRPGVALSVTREAQGLLEEMRHERSRVDG